MKQFNNIYDACRYHTHCYVCHSQLRIDQNYTFEHDLRGNNRTMMSINMTLGVDSDTDDFIKVDVLTGQIECYSVSRKINYDEIFGGNFDFSGSAPIRKSYAANLPPSVCYPKYSGTLYRGISMTCPKCHQFSYVIQLQIDMTLNVVTGIYLNSELISVEESDAVHEIRNIYTTNMTEYVYLPAEGKINWNKDKKITIPLIPLNLKEPMETISRIKKLIIFL